MSKKSGQPLLFLYFRGTDHEQMYGVILEISIHEMLSFDMVEPDPDHSPMILAIVPLEKNLVRPMVLFWSGKWIDDHGDNRQFIKWTYISVTEEIENGNKNI